MNVLARALLPVAHRALALPPARPLEDEPRLLAALDAIDGFLAQPVASRYLVATRTLDELTRLRRRSAQVDILARRSLDAELVRLQTRAVLPAGEGAEGTDPIDALRALPADPRAGRRLQALGALLEAHRELALRSRAPETHRAKMAKPEGAGAQKRKGERRKK